MPKAAVNETTTPTATTYEAGQSVSATTGLVINTPIGIDTQRHRKRDIEAAVYSYIQAMRTLGNTRVNSGDIAKALGLTVANVNAVLPKLNEKGVKRVG
jgi:hypothetical protein